MIFDILTEPWMGVIDKETGEVLKVGLKDYIVNAHMYKCSAENKDFAIIRRLQQRLAEAVVIDIYGRAVNDELMSVFNNGRFDADKIDAYFDECIKNGTSFDLFDVEKPFMQVDAKTAESVFKENSITSVSSINAKQCGGNNKVFFQHVDVNDYIENFGGIDNRDSYYDEAQIDGRHIEFANSVKFDEYMNLILMDSCIAGMRGQSYVREESSRAPFCVDREFLIKIASQAIRENEEQLKSIKKWGGQSSENGLWDEIQRYKKLFISKFGFSQRYF